MAELVAASMAKTDTMCASCIVTVGRKVWNLEEVSNDMLNRLICGQDHRCITWDKTRAIECLNMCWLLNGGNVGLVAPLGL